MPDEVSPLVIALVGGGFTVLGVLLKVVYDVSVERLRVRREDVPTRRDAYEAFLEALNREKAYWRELHTLVEVQRAGGSVSQERMDEFPASPMGELVSALERVRRLSHTYSVIKAAEAIVQLFADMAASARAAITSPGPDDEIQWFLLQRFQEDREREFVYAYRQDLGVGAPKGAPRDYPKRDLPFDLGAAERHLRRKLLSSEQRDNG